MELAQAPERGPSPHPTGAFGSRGLCFQIAFVTDSVPVDVLGDIFDDVAHGAALLLVHYLPVKAGRDVAMGLFALRVAFAFQVAFVMAQGIALQDADQPVLVLGFDPYQQVPVGRAVMVGFDHPKAEIVYRVGH
ncbi:hypothetical protein D3C79_730090 [compost metagenome]